MDIDELLDPQDNNMLSKLSTNGTQSYLKLLNNYYIKYQKVLKTVNDLTYGFEFECDKVDINMIYKHANSLAKECYEIAPELSLLEGLEIKSPILINRKVDWKNVRTVCHLLNKYAIVNDATGSHIHIGVQALGSKNDVWYNFLLTYATYEDIIFRFGYGEFLNKRKCLVQYAGPIYSDVRKYLLLLKEQCIQELLETGEITKAKNNSINFGNIDDLNKFSFNNTIEFRMFNGTLNPVIWQNNLNMLFSLIKYAKSPNCDREFLEYRLNSSNDTLGYIRKYQKINVDKALEFADLIFTNNRDKNNFLRQYFKDFTEPNSFKLTRSKSFTE